MSEERLFDNTSGTEHYSTAYPTKHGRDRDLGLRIPLHKIHVREDVEIDTQSVIRLFKATLCMVKYIPTYG